MRWYWIDRFVEFESGRYAKAIKGISLAEDHLHDHFPGFPTMPKSLVIEGLAQTGGLLVCEHTGFEEKVVLAKIPKARFFGEAFPGDRLLHTATIEDVRRDGAIVTATSHIGDQLYAEVEIVFAHLNDQFGEKTLFVPQDLLRMMRVLGAFDVGHGPDGSPLVDPGEAPRGGKSGKSAVPRAQDEEAL